MTDSLHVTFVCTGNICRSPMGEFILRDLLTDAGLEDFVTVDSASTSTYEIGNPADPRTVAELRRRGHDGTGHVAREFRPEWFAHTDLVLAADRGHRRALRRWARNDMEREQVQLIREFDPAAVAAGTLEVDDPWYGDDDDFVRCFDEVEAACRGLFYHLRARLDR